MSFVSAQPYCSSCKITGKQHVKVTPLDKNVLLVHCRICGAIHGVLPSFAPSESDKKSDLDTSLSLISSQDTTTLQSSDEIETDFKPYLVKPRPKVKQNDKFIHHVSFTTVDLARILSLILSKKIVLSDQEASQMYFDADNKVDEVRVCSRCQMKMIKLAIPDGLPHAREFFWICPTYQTCRQWVSPNGAIKPLERPLLTNIPNTNCPKCNQKMRNMKIPKGYKGAGRKVWACASCQYWRYDLTAKSQHT